MDPAARKCDECRSPPRSPTEKLLCCKRCLQTFYCDAACQEQHHGRSHKLVCQLKADRRNPNLFVFDGLEVIQTKVVGRAVVSTREFELGSMVIAEPPTMFFKTQEGFLEMFDAFLRLTRKDQGTIMSLQESSLSGRSVFLIQGEYQSFKHNNRVAANHFTVAMAKKLLAIVNENSQRFELKNTLHNTLPSVKTPEERILFTGIYSAACMVEHSCNPNCSTTIREGLIYCIASRNITTLDRISISYLPNVYEKPRQQRQDYLELVKSFSCHCSRCMSYDECNPINCPDCAQGVMFQNGKTAEWECYLCGELHNSFEPKIRTQLKLLDEVSMRLDSIQNLLQEGDLRSALFHTVELSQTTSIHPMSWIHMKAWQYIAESAASTARMLMQHHKKAATNPKVASLLRMSGLAMLNRVQWMERNIPVVQGEMSLETAIIRSNCSEPWHKFRNENEILQQDVENVVAMIISEPLRSIDDQCLMETFQAAQDLVLAGDMGAAFRLLKRIENHLKCCVRLSREEQKGLKIFLRSQGGESPFRNCLLD